MIAAIATLLARECKRVWRSPMQAVSGLLFFIVAASLFPLALGPDPTLLRSVGPGVLWVAALLAVLLSAPRLFAADHAQGLLEQMVLSPHPLSLLVLAKVAACWFIIGLPLTLAAPLLALQFDLSAATAGWLMLTLALGTPALMLIAGVSAALVLEVRGAGALTALITLPLYVPVLVFGVGAATAAAKGNSPEAALSLLGACLALTLVFAPPATAAALRIALE